MQAEFLPPRVSVHQRGTDFLVRLSTGWKTRSPFIGFPFPHQKRALNVEGNSGIFNASFIGNARSWNQLDVFIKSG
jgi:hypothetical protein